MRLGLDLDNTIVCYDHLFRDLAVARGLVPADYGASKTEVREHLRTAGREDDWTELQGVAYGEGMSGAEAFPGVLEFVRGNRDRYQIFIVSHRTRRPFRGPDADLHAAALAWLSRNGLLDLLGEDAVFLEEAREGKMDRIRELRCDVFVDDLPEFLTEPEFPSGVMRILFDPGGRHEDDPAYVRCPGWEELESLLGSGIERDG